MTPAEKAKRYAYQKARQQKINQAAREAGVIGAPRPKMSEAERKAKRREYNKAYRKQQAADAAAYRLLMSSGKVKKSK